MYTHLPLLSFAVSLLSSPVHGLSIPNGRTVPLSFEERDVQTHSIVTEYIDPKPFAAPTELEVTDNFLKLETIPSTGSRSAHYLNKLRARNEKRQTGSAQLQNVQGVEFLTKLTWAGGSQVSVIVDTGSSDTWLISSSYKCVDGDGNQVSTSSCNFGPSFTGSYKYGQIANTNFNITYGDGEFVTGTFGKTDVTIAGLTVKSQQVALGTLAFWNGDGMSTGLLGLAYGSITSAYAGTNPRQNTQRVPYDPLFTTMYKQKLVQPSFSLAIQRGSNGGYIAFGGLPPVSGYTKSFTPTPIRVLQLAGLNGGYTFYTINTDGFYVGSSKQAGIQTIVDSGTSLNYLPSSMAAAVAAAFKPAATFDNNQGAYTVPCTATAPRFAVIINGTNFETNSQDMVLQASRDGSGKCLLGIQDGGTQGPFILGDTFLQNVIAVFDVGATQMRFAAHVNY